MDVNLTYYDIEIPSDTIRRVSVAYAWIVIPLNLVLLVVSINIILFYSPVTMGAYKWYVVWTITNHVMLNTFLATLEVECLSIRFELLARGIVEYLEIPSLGPILRILFYNFFEINTYITICRFLFRYAQTTGKQRLLNFLSHKLFLRFLYILFLILLLKSLWFNRFMWEDGDKFKENFPNTNPEVKEYIMKHTVLIPRTGIFEHIFLYGVFPSTLLIGSYCTYQCYRTKKNATWLSERTRHMYRLLIYGLVIEQIAEFLWILLPLAVMHTLKPRQESLGLYFVFRMFYLYPTFVMVFTLSFYRSYREAVRMLIHRLSGSDLVSGSQVSIVRTSSRVQTIST